MRRVLFSAACAIALSGCGPSAHDLLAGNHFREAACATEEGHGDPREVSDAITRALDPQIHVDVMSDETVAAAAPAAPPDLHARVLFVRVRVATNEIPMDRLGLSLDTAGDAPAHVLNLFSLAELTGERPPPSHTGTETHYLRNAVSGAVTIFTLGLIDPGQQGPTTVEIPATDYEWKQAAPSAHSLYSAFNGQGCTERRGGADDAQHVGMTCDATFMVERASPGSLSLDLGMVYSAQRLGHNEEMRAARDESSWTCRVKSRLHVQLGAVRELPKNTTATFGPRFRPVRELHATARSSEIVP